MFFTAGEEKGGGGLMRGGRPRAWAEVNWVGGEAGRKKALKPLSRDNSRGK